MDKNALIVGQAPVTLNGTKVTAQAVPALSTGAVLKSALFRYAWPTWGQPPSAVHRAKLDPPPILFVILSEGVRFVPNRTPQSKDPYLARTLDRPSKGVFGTPGAAANRRKNAAHGASHWVGRHNTTGPW